MKKDTKSLRALYDFMASAYMGNWQYRWGGVPWMEKSAKAGRQESILAHQWACMGFWTILKDMCPALSLMVDTRKIYEIIWSHDLGETFIGDISQYRQLDGLGVNKHILERRELLKMSRHLLPKTSKRILGYFDEFEKPIEKITKVEVLVAKLLDVIEGNHFALVFGDGLSQYPEKIEQIVNKTFVRVSARLLEVLKLRGKLKAYKEVLLIVEHHLKHYRKLGIKVKHPALYRLS